MTEQELTILARKGDQEAFAQLVRDNERRVYTLALRMCGSPEDALAFSTATGPVAALVGGRNRRNLLYWP